MSHDRRLKQLEGKRREWEAQHVPRSDVTGFIFTVLDIVQAEAGPAVASRIMGRVLVKKAERVEALYLAQLKSQGQP